LRFCQAGGEYVIDHLARAISSRGLAAELFHCALGPKRVEHILVPELELGITISCDPHKYRGKASIVEDLNSLVNQKRLALYRRDMERAHRDSRYAPNMAFWAVNVCRENTLKRILNILVR